MYINQWYIHYNDVTMGTMAFQMTSLTIVYSTVYSGADQRKHQSYASLAFVLGIHRWPKNSPHKWPVTRKMFPFDDVTIYSNYMLTQHDAISELLDTYVTDHYPVFHIVLKFNVNNKSAERFWRMINEEHTKKFPYRLLIHWSDAYMRQ